MAIKLRPTRRPKRGGGTDPHRQSGADKQSSADALPPHLRDRALDAAAVFLDEVKSTFLSLLADHESRDELNAVFDGGVIMCNRSECERPRPHLILEASFGLSYYRDNWEPQHFCYVLQRSLDVLPGNPDYLMRVVAFEGGEPRSRFRDPDDLPHAELTSDYASSIVGAIQNLAKKCMILVGQFGGGPLAPAFAAALKIQPKEDVLH